MAKQDKENKGVVPRCSVSDMMPSLDLTTTTASTFTYDLKHFDMFIIQDIRVWAIIFS